MKSVLAVIATCDVVTAYLNLLACSDHIPSLRIVDTHIVEKLQTDGWNAVRRWVKESELVPGDWETADLIFIPAFFGDTECGHWTAIIVDRSNSTTSVIFVDSCESTRRENFQRKMKILLLKTQPLYRWNRPFRAVVQMIVQYSCWVHFLHG